MGHDERPETHEGSAGRVAVFGELAAGTVASVHVGRLAGARGAVRTVAVKRVRPELAGDPDFAAALRDEARLAAKVRHPNVVETLDVIARGDELVLVLEYVASESLARLLHVANAAGAQVPQPIASAVLLGVLQGLHAAHEAKNEFGEPLDVVHRDVTPAAVLVGVDGIARIGGFGVARAIARLPQTRWPADWPAAYLAPEQVRGTPVGRKADVFAAAAVLWETLAQEPLFLGADEAATRKNVLGMAVVAPSSRAGGISPRVDAVVLRGLERDPQKRWATAADMAAALEQALAPAAASEVAAWVRETAEAALSRRAQRVAEAESRAAPSVSPPSRRPSSRPPPRGRGPEIIAASEFIADALWSDLPREPAASRLEPAPRARDRRADEDDVRPSREPVARDDDAGARRSSRAPESAREPVIELDLPKPPPEPPKPRAPRLPRRIVRSVATAGIVLLALLGVLSLVLPGYVRQRVVDALAQRGITATIDEVTLGLETVKLHGITLACADVPEIKATLAEVKVELATFTPKLATVRGVEVTIDGTWASVLASAQRFREAHAGGAARGDDGGGVKVMVPAARLAWTGILGEGSKLDAPDLTVDLTPRGSARVGDEFHVSSKKLALTTKLGALGPWRVDVDRDESSSRLRLAFDPPVPDGPNVLFVWGAGGETNVDANIPRSPLPRLGLSPEIGALVPASPQQIEAQVHYARMVARVEASATVTLVDAKVPPAPGLMEVTVSGAVTGDPRGPLDLKNGTLVAGPFKASVTGPVSFDDGVRADLAWKAAPVSCAQLAPKGVQQMSGDLAKQLGQLGNMGDLKQQLGDLGIDLGDLGAVSVPHVTGTVNATGTLVVDSSDPARSAFTVKAKNTCGLSGLGGLGGL
jgi:serine/threonine-protein kinase